MTIGDTPRPASPEGVVSPTQSDKHRTVTTVLAGASVGVPALIVFLTGLAWRHDLPEHVAIHWNANGRPDGTFPAEPLFWMAQIVSTLCLVVGVVVLLVPSTDTSDTRKAMMLLGTVSAFAAAAWVVSAGSTLAAHAGSQAGIGAWLVLFVVALLWGLIPKYLTPGAK